MTNGMGWPGDPVAPRASCCPTKLVTLPRRPPTMALRLSARGAPRNRLIEETRSRGTTGKPYRILAVMFPDGADPARANR